MQDQPCVGNSQETDRVVTETSNLIQLTVIREKARIHIMRCFVCVLVQNDW